MNNRGNFQVKKRALRPDLGAAGDNLYHTASGSSFGMSTWTKDALSKWAIDTYRSYKALRNTASAGVTSWPLGHEEIHTTSGKGNMGMKNCLHTVQRAVQYPYLYSSLAWNYNAGPYSTDYRAYYWRDGATSAYWKDASETALGWAAGYNDDLMFSARAYWSMRPKFQSEVSLINTIFELKDFSDAANFMFEGHKGVGDPRRNLSSHANRFTTFASRLLKLGNQLPAIQNKRRKAALRQAGKLLNNAKDWLTQPGAIVRDVTSFAANAQLTWALAIMPTIQDTMAIHAEAQKDVYDLAKQFKEFGEEGARSHYSEAETLLCTVIPGSKNDQYFGTGKNVEIRRTATMVSYYQVLWQRIEDRYPKWWGLEIGADEVWNMLPLSFVLDYIFTIGKSLEYMDRDDSVEVHRYEYCESTKVLATLGRHYIHNARTNALVIDGQYIVPRQTGTRRLLVTGTMGSYYKRVVKEPYRGPALPKFKAPSAGQAVNLLALARCLLF